MSKENFRPYWLLIFFSLFLWGCDQKPAPEMQTGRFSVESHDGNTIFYEVAGKGDPALVFVHCWTCNGTFWDDQFETFARQHRVVRLDLVGHGESGKQREKYTMQAFGADVAAVVNALKLDKVVLIGHSMGGPVSVEAEKQLGDRVIGIIGVDTFFTGFPYPITDEEIAAFIQPFKDDFVKTGEGMIGQMLPPEPSPALVERIKSVVLKADQRMAVSAIHEIFDWNRTIGPASLQALGERLKNINGEPMGESIEKHASVTIIPGTGHFVQMEKPAEFNRALMKMVSEFKTSN